MFLTFSESELRIFLNFYFVVMTALRYWLTESRCVMQSPVQETNTNSKAKNSRKENKNSKIKSKFIIISAIKFQTTFYWIFLALWNFESSSEKYRNRFQLDPCSKSAHFWALETEFWGKNWENRKRPYAEPRPRYAI